MKNIVKITSILFSLSVILFSCVNEEQISPDGEVVDRIGFAVRVEDGKADTRAVVSGTALPTSGTTGHFGLYGYSGANLYADRNSKSLNNTRMTSLGAYYTSGTEVVWASPATDITFYAYYPYNTTPGVSVTNAGIELGYTLAADPSASLAANTDWLFASNKASSGSSVGLQFTHALCRLAVRAKYVDKTTGSSTMIVTGVATNSVNTTGTYNYVNSATTPFGTGTWKNLGTVTNRTKTGLSQSLTNGASSFTSLVDFFMIPQGKSAQNVTISCTLGGVAKSLNIPVGDMPTFNEAGKIYYLDVTITATDTAVQITPSVSVTNWTQSTTTGSGTIEK